MARTALGVCFIGLPEETEVAATDRLMENLSDLVYDSGAFETLDVKLKRFCEGEQIDFGDIVLDLSEHTAFRQAVWDITRAIPYGTTRSYGSIAAEVGRPKGARAIGQAMGANPVPLIVPCHRVVASDGSLHGFAGGLPMKESLLRLEGLVLRGARVDNPG